MTGRQTAAIELALAEVARGATASTAARMTDVAISTLRRALRRAAVPPLPRGRPAKQA